MRHKAAPRTGVDWFLLVLKVALFSVIGFGLFAFVLQQLDPNNWLAQRINDDATGLTADANYGESRLRRADVRLVAGGCDTGCVQTCSDQV